MRVSIEHETEYRYDAPIRGGVQYLRKTPRSGVSQSVRLWRVRGPGDLTQWTDHFGNICHTQVVEGASTAVAVTVTGEVDTLPCDGVVPQEPGELPIAYFLRQDAYTLPDAAIRAFAELHREEVGDDRPTGLRTLMTAIGEAVTYQPGETHVHTTAAEALTQGRGVCQDHAHVFASCCRLLGVPARYVSGYLVTGDGGAAEHDAGHAWAEAFVPERGWFGFDPANGVMPDTRYVRVAVALDYAGAGPVRGVRRGGGEETLAVTIRIGDHQQ